MTTVVTVVRQASLHSMRPSAHSRGDDQMIIWGIRKVWCRVAETLGARINH
jgi:hypothetical protein